MTPELENIRLFVLAIFKVLCMTGLIIGILGWCVMRLASRSTPKNDPSSGSLSPDPHKH